MLIEQIYTSNIIDELMTNMGVSKKWREDLKSEVILILLNSKEKVENIPNNEIRFFLAKIIKNQYHSTTSPFFLKYRKFPKLTEEITNNDD